MKTTYTTELCGDKFEITADFAQASCPISGDHCGRQVADFQHRPEKAMRAQLEYYMQMSGEGRDENGDWEDDSVETQINNAIEAMIGRDADLIEMAKMLEGHGSQFTGNNVDDEAQGWLDNGFDAEDAGAWCLIGCWDAETAAEWRDADMTPDQINSADTFLRDSEDADEKYENGSKYTDGSPIYAACNNDINADVLIDAVSEMVNA